MSRKTGGGAVPNQRITDPRKTLNLKLAVSVQDLTPEESKTR